MRRNNLLVAVSFVAVLASGVVWSAAKAADKAPRPADVEKVKAALPEKVTVAPPAERRILIVDKCQGFYHGVIPLATEAFKLLGEKTGAYTADVAEDLSELNAENLAQYDAILFNNTTRLTPTDEQKQAILDFVRSGKGIIGVHAATDNFYQWPEGAAMMGGLFAGHPWGGGGTWAFKIDEPDHPLCKGFAGKGFLAKEEVYKMKAPYSREKLRVLVSLDMEEGRNVPGREDGDNAVAWIHREGEGRVFYCSLGHNKEIFQTPEIMQHYLDGIQYALGDLACCDTPSAALETKPEPALCPKSE